MSRISLFLVFFFALDFFTFATARAGIETAAEYALMVDYDTGAVLLDKQADTPMHPASMTKLMTAYLVFDALKRGEIAMDTAYRVSDHAWKQEGSRMFLKPDTEVSVHDLIRGIIVHSGNDACITVAEGMSGSEAAFVENMNAMAQKIGMKSSHFQNTSGLPDEHHLMTARDLVTLARRLMDDFPEYYPLYSTKDFTYNNVRQESRNKLLWRDLGADGLKTGFTEQSGYGMVASARKDGRRVILTINGMPSAKARIEEADRLLRHGLHEFKNVALYKAGDTVDSAEIWMGQEDTVPLAVSGDVELTVPRRTLTMAQANGDIELAVVYNTPWPAPVAKGTHLANLVVKQSGTLVQEVPLLAGKDIPKASWFKQFLVKLRYYAAQWL